MRQILRRAGGSLVMTVPKTFVDQNRLEVGSQVELVVLGAQMTVNAAVKPRYSLEQLMAEMPDAIPRVDGWDTMPLAGEESM